PWCDAPIRHADHPVRASDGGETSAENGQGLCEACNYAKEAAGWRSLPLPSDRHEVLITTPTGHTYVSSAPDPPQPHPPQPHPLPDGDAGDLVHFYSVWRGPDEELRALLA
ncbi:MAG: HNH endonuclease, partial [Aeromicrobium sp.]